MRKYVVLGTRQRNSARSARQSRMRGRLPIGERKAGLIVGGEYGRGANKDLYRKELSAEIVREGKVRMPDSDKH